MFTETIFAWPGLGDLLVTAVGNRDYPLIQGLVFLSATTLVVLNLLVDSGTVFSIPVCSCHEYSP